MNLVYKETSANMGFARCGVEGNLRNILENTRWRGFLIRDFPQIILFTLIKFVKN